MRLDLGGQHPESPLEQLAEVRRVGESQLPGHFLHGRPRLAVLQDQEAPVHLLVEEGLLQRDPLLFFEFVGQVVGMVAELLSQGRDSRFPQRLLGARRQMQQDPFGENVVLLLLLVLQQEGFPGRQERADLFPGVGLVQEVLRDGDLLADDPLGLMDVQNRQDPEDHGDETAVDFPGVPPGVVGHDLGLRLQGLQELSRPCAW